MIVYLHSTNISLWLCLLFSDGKNSNIFEETQGGRYYVFTFYVGVDCNQTTIKIKLSVLV
jgi:hypothetical protein